MKPISSHTMSRLVCTMRAMLNGMCREQQVADQVLQAQRMPKTIWPDEQAECADEIQRATDCDSNLRVLMVPSAFDVRRPLLGVHAVGPLEELHQVVELLLVEWNCGICRRPGAPVGWPSSRP
jgi:hypothetical protein